MTADRIYALGPTGLHSIPLLGLDPDPRDASPDAAADGCPVCGRDIDRQGGNPDCPICAAEPPAWFRDEHGAGLLQPFVDLFIGAAIAAIAFWLGWFARGRSR